MREIPLTSQETAAPSTRSRTQLQATQPLERLHRTEWLLSALRRVEINGSFCSSPFAFPIGMAIQGRRNMLGLLDPWVLPLSPHTLVSTPAIWSLCGCTHTSRCCARPPRGQLRTGSGWHSYRTACQQQYATPVTKSLREARDDNRLPTAYPRTSFSSHTSHLTSSFQTSPGMP